ncbi:MAG: metallophosphoesterase [Ruminococcus sp.]|nr:metallophosphoesterase [Ruminococcus sp.]
MSKVKKKRIVIICTAVVLMILTLWIAFENKALETNYFTIESDKIPASFDSFKIAHISDLHNAEIGKDNKRLIRELKSANPDIIAVTGDIIDSRNTDVNIAVNFMKEAVQIAPCYFVNGNHEERVPVEYEKLKYELLNLNVTMLENDSIKIENDGEFITIAGINDPVFYADIVRPNLTETSINNVIPDDDSFTVLLSHRPELFELYVKYNCNLVLTGHAHGGQFRLPFIGGLYAPHQGAFPEYDSGLYTKQNTNMLVSRGIGNSLFPFRINNRPEIIIAELKAK